MATGLVTCQSTRPRGLTLGCFDMSPCIESRKEVWRRGDLELAEGVALIYLSKPNLIYHVTGHTPAGCPLVHTRPVRHGIHPPLCSDIIQIAPWKPSAKSFKRHGRFNKSRQGVPPCMAHPGKQIRCLRRTDIGVSASEVTAILPNVLYPDHLMLDSRHAGGWNGRMQETRA